MTARATGSKSKRPKPYPRPGVAAKDRDVKTFRAKPMPIDEMRQWLGWDPPKPDPSQALIVHDPFAATIAAR